MSDITLLHVHGKSIGYARLGTCLHEALEKRGVTVYDDLGDPPEGFYESSSDAMVRKGRTLAPSPTNVVSWVSVPTHARWWYDGQYTSIFTMWEASILPEAFRSTMHHFDRIIVPSEHNVELFSKYHDSVRYVPLGVETDRWHYIPRKTPDPFFNFLIGGSGARKGTDLAHAAFMTVFGPLFDSEGRWTGDGPIPRLVMKNPKGERFFGPNVEVVSGRLSDDEEVTLYSTAHCYVQPSRGEGFGLQPLQAIAQGIPTILTDAHGHKAFSNLGIPIGWKWKEAQYFIFGHAGEWWEPDFEELCEAMWDVYANYETHRHDAEFYAKRIVPYEFSWAEVAKNYVAAHDGELDLPYRGSGGFLVPDEKRYLMRVREPFKADIAGVTYFWQPGKDYYEPADVKRILFEAGKLDPVCLTDDDTGLTSEQLERVPRYSGSMSACPACGRECGCPTAADRIYAEMEAAAR